MPPKVPAAKKGEKRAGKAKSAPMDGSSNKKRKERERRVMPSISTRSLSRFIPIRVFLERPWVS